jgi:hypothetical protein
MVCGNFFDKTQGMGSPYPLPALDQATGTLKISLESPYDLTRVRVFLPSPPPSFSHKPRGGRPHS